ncbi:MAG: DNA repair protein RadC [Cyclobacteriaceae bacterium]|jgi:DNA repair protein RadC|nr:DNA repair protein RadC [Cyclobacteriaceae bacterium]
MEKETPTYLTIKDWSPDDRPREKLLRRGRAALTDAELIAILLGSGTTTASAVDVAKSLLAKVDNDLDKLALLSVKDLTRVRGIGMARAITIVAAMELGRRRGALDHEDRPRITCSRDVFELLRPTLMDLPHEEFWVLLLNRANRVIKRMQISQGGVSGTVADPRIIFKSALEELASGIILAHNHPSGNLTASQADKDLTRKLREGGRLIDVQVIDHVILAGQRYYSFADEGLLP